MSDLTGSGVGAIHDYKDVLTTPRFIVIKEEIDQSDQGYSDHPEHVMVDVRYWHLADITTSVPEVGF